jgi:hypothetical protein
MVLNFEFTRDEVETCGKIFMELVSNRKNVVNLAKNRLFLRHK